MIHKTYRVGQRNINCTIGFNLLCQSTFEHLKNRKILIITDQTVGDLYYESLCQALPSSSFDRYTVPTGEQAKTQAVYHSIIDYLIEHQYDKKTVIIALGGGTVTDLAGFVAATFYRGIDLILVPTTLMAQADAALGGKTALNHALGKNMIGSVYHPSQVVVDVSLLNSLSDRLFNEGMAEVIKMALLSGIDELKKLKNHSQALQSRHLPTLQKVIETAIDFKYAIVKQDEFDQGIRQQLNFGHTIGHAIEYLSDYKLLHGEAVAIGMSMELAKQAPEVAALYDDTLHQLLSIFQLPTSTTICQKRINAQMLKDKKTIDGQVRWVKV